MFGEILSEEGYVAVCCRDEQETYESVMAEQPDLLIVDLRMEHLDSGVRVVERLRAEERTRDLPILVCSADITFLRERADQLRRHGCDFLEKPFDIEDLLGRVDAALSNASPHEDERGTAQPGNAGYGHGKSAYEGTPRMCQYNALPDRAWEYARSTPRRIERGIGF
jgi:DNA-binding response OmpR family regulator